MREQLKEIFERHKVNCLIHCDKCHTHSAERGCLVGPVESIEICMLGEYISILESHISAIKILVDEVNEGRSL